MRLQPWLRGVPTPQLLSPANCALQVLRQKRLYEGQRDQLYQQQFNVEQTAFAMTSMQARRQGLCFCGGWGCEGWARSGGLLRAKAAWRIAHLV